MTYSYTALLVCTLQVSGVAVWLKPFTHHVQTCAYTECSSLSSLIRPLSYYSGGVTGVFWGGILSKS